MQNSLIIGSFRFYHSGRIFTFKQQLNTDSVEAGNSEFSLLAAALAVKRNAS